MDFSIVVCLDPEIAARNASFAKTMLECSLVRHKIRLRNQGLPLESTWAVVSVGLLLPAGGNSRFVRAYTTTGRPRY